MIQTIHAASRKKAVLYSSRWIADYAGLENGFVF